MKVLNAASEFTRSISISRHQVYRKLHQTYIVQKQKYSANQEKNSYWPYDIKLRNKANSHIQPDNPQVDIATTGRCEYWITDIDIIMKHQGNDTESPSDDPILSEVYTATVACNLQQTVYAKACSPLSASTFYKGLLKRQNTAAYMTAFTRPPWICIKTCRPHHTQIYCYLQTCKPKD